MRRAARAAPPAGQEADEEEVRQVLSELMLEPDPGGPVLLLDEAAERLAVGKQSGRPTWAGRLEGGGVHA